MKPTIYCITAEDATKHTVVPNGLMYWCTDKKKWTQWPCYRTTAEVPKLNISLGGGSSWFSVSGTHEATKKLLRYEPFKPNYVIHNRSRFECRVMQWQGKTYKYEEMITPEFFTIKKIDPACIPYLKQELTLNPSQGFVFVSDNVVDVVKEFVDIVKGKVTFSNKTILSEFILEAIPIQTELEILKLRTQ